LTIRGWIGEDRQERLQEEERPLEIDRNRPIEAGLVPFLQRMKVADASVEERHVAVRDKFGALEDGRRRLQSERRSLTRGKRRSRRTELPAWQIRT